MYLWTAFELGLATFVQAFLSAFEGEVLPVALSTCWNKGTGFGAVGQGVANVGSAEHVEETGVQVGGTAVERTASSKGGMAFE